MDAQPRLLVSVRNLEEARDAIAGGAEIIDLKEPDAGSLGMADRSSIQAVIQWKNSKRIDVPVSAALGELSEWDHRDYELIPEGLDYVKVGLAREDPFSFGQRLMDLRAQVASTQTNPPRWVTVAYADSRAACSPSVDDIARFAISSNSAGLLVDTYHKTGVPLTEIMSVDQLADLGSMLNQHGLFFAIAGQIQPNNVSDCLNVIRPQIIAVRSAACRHGDRTQPVSRSAVESLKRVLDSGQANQPTSLETSSTPTNKS